MATAKAKTTKSNTAMVYNPARKLTVGGVRRSTNPARKTRKKRRTNPTTKRVVNASSHRRRRTSRRSNPAGFTGLIGAMLIAGGGVFLFDILTRRFLPSMGAMASVGVKLGGAFLMQSGIGSKVPLLGKYKNEIALVLGVSAVVDLLQIYAMPVLNQVTGNFLVPAPVAAIAAGELGDDFYVVEELDEDGEDEYYDV